jgi:hypothetical protein
MNAYRRFGWKAYPRPVDIPQLLPGPDETPVKAGGNDFCNSDLHALDEMPRPSAITMFGACQEWQHCVPHRAASLE